MPPRRRAATRAHPASEEGPDQREAARGEVQELRAQVARLSEASRRQEERMERMMRMLEQEASPVAGSVVPPVVTSSTSTRITPLTEQEQRELADRLLFFSQFHPPRFSGQSSEPWEAENWIAAMEKLFENRFIKEKHQVHLATHFLEMDAEVWWRRVRPVGPPGAQLLTWREFRALLLGVYFPDSARQKMEEDLRRLQQGNRPLHEYVREFQRLLSSVPHVARDEAQRVDLFERGLHQDIYHLVHSHRSPTLDAAIECARWVSRGRAIMAERDGAPGTSSRERGPVSPDFGQPSGSRTPRSPQSQFQDQGSQRRQRSGGSRQSRRQRQSQDQCVICGGPHPAPQCDHRQGRCFSCGEPGHFQAECPSGVLMVLPLATAPPLPFPGEEDHPTYR